MKQLVIFDLDGTLLNTIADLAAATNYALAKLGYPIHPEQAYFQFVGNGINKLFERALPEFARTSENIRKMRDLFVPYYDAHNADKTVPYKGIAEVLKNLQARGVKLAVASNKYQAATEKLIAHYFPEISFVAVCGQQDGFPLKPDAALVHYIMQEAQVPAEHTLYVGDSNVDMQTAKNAKVDACAVLWGFRSREELAAFAPAYMISQPADLLDII